jgi:hypothetical protein
VFALDDKRVLKVMRASDGGTLKREEAAMRAAGVSGIAVPTPHEIVDVDGRPALVMDRIDGVDILSLSLPDRGPSLVRARNSGAFTPGCTRSWTT